ncbi:hypothetical Protein YC6258_05505 [Gynuella sunshinyii YC6258]|uniref:Uncharacterized protein n=2 Tax=Gynuella sunshinyii TaxID=1445505 RepID=A0A0C5VW26_9GAMM|nr:hypothetical Protein YC6258_05505 [Gynuella sunshinyii YC6258]
MTSSYTFMDDVYQFNVPALERRMENWANHLYETTNLPICLSAKYLNFQEVPDINISVCSSGTKLSELVRKSKDSGSVDIRLGDKLLGEIEWLTQTKFNFPLFFKIYACYLVSFSVVLLSGFYLFLYKPKPENNQDEESVILTASDIRQSLYRVMGNNRRILGFHDNWIYGERSHPYINFINLDGSKLRIRASLSDIAVIFPGTRHISRSAIINTAVGVHQFRENQVILTIKGEPQIFDIDPSYMEMAVI